LAFDEYSCPLLPICKLAKILPKSSFNISNCVSPIFIRKSSMALKVIPLKTMGKKNTVLCIPLW